MEYTQSRFSRFLRLLLRQCAQIGHANHVHTITGYVRVKKVEAVSMVARATNFSSSEFKNSEMLENLWETSALSLFCLYNTRIKKSQD